MAPRSKSILSSEKKTVDLEDKGREEYARQRTDRGRTGDEHSLALVKPANIRADLKKRWSRLSTQRVVPYFENPQEK
jgi:hypothetical protein